MAKLTEEQKELVATAMTIAVKTVNRMTRAQLTSLGGYQIALSECYLQLCVLTVEYTGEVPYKAYISLLLRKRVFESIKIIIRRREAERKHKDKLQELIKSPIVEPELPDDWFDCSQLMALVHRLEERNRYIIVRHVVDGMRLKEIAKELNVGEAWVKTLWGRSIKALRSMINSSCGE